MQTSVKNIIFSKNWIWIWRFGYTMCPPWVNMIYNIFIHDAFGQYSWSKHVGAAKIKANILQQDGIKIYVYDAAAR